MEKKDSIFAKLTPAPSPAQVPPHLPAPSPSQILPHLPAPSPSQVPPHLPMPSPSQITPHVFAPSPAQTPSPAPIPSPAQVPPAVPTPAQASAPRPAAPDPEVAALKQKIDAMEKNILTQLEKKIGEHLAAPVPPPAAPAGPRPPEIDAAELLARIGELDKRLEDFGRNAMMSASQLKNIEESKIGARREIEDLLKVVREQQKYSEMDREMHDQLSKSWGRAEELEKKLIDFCGAVLASQQNKGGAEAVRFDPGARIADGVLPGLADLKKEMTAELAKTREETLALSREQAGFFKGMFEEQVKGRLELIQSSVTAGLELSRRDAAAEMELFKREFVGHMTDIRGVLEELVKSRLAAIQSSVTAELERSHRDAAAEMELFKREFVGHMTDDRGMVEELVKSRLEAIQSSVTAELERSHRDASAEMELFKKEFAGQMTDMRKILEDFNRAARENCVRTEGVEKAVAKNTADTAALLQGNLEKIGETLGREGGKFLAELEECNRRHFKALNAKYSDVLSNASILELVGASADATVKKITALEETLSGFMKQADKDRLSAALGVSGMLVRKDFDDMESLLAGMRQDVAGLERIKKEVRDRLKGGFGEGCK